MIVEPRWHLGPSKQSSIPMEIGETKDTMHSNRKPMHLFSPGQHGLRHNSRAGVREAMSSNKYGRQCARKVHLNKLHKDVTALKSLPFLYLSLRAPSVFLFVCLFFNVSLVLLILTMNGACEVGYFSEVFSYGRIFAILTFSKIF